MAGLNKVILIGNLGRDPELRYTGGGQAVANFSVATTERWTNKNGEREEHTEWWRVAAWGKLAETCGEYLAKGKQVYVEGRLRIEEWEDRDGNKRMTPQVTANVVQMLGRRGEGDAGGGGGGGGRGGDDRGPGPDLPPDQSDDIPF